jgi:hypothetical protein
VVEDNEADDEVKEEEVDEERGGDDTDKAVAKVAVERQFGEEKEGAAVTATAVAGAAVTAACTTPPPPHGGVAGTATRFCRLLFFFTNPKGTCTVVSASEGEIAVFSADVSQHPSRHPPDATMTTVEAVGVGCCKSATNGTGGEEEGTCRL